MYTKAKISCISYFQGNSTKMIPSSKNLLNKRRMFKLKKVHLIDFLKFQTNIHIVEFSFFETKMYENDED